MKQLRRENKEVLWQAVENNLTITDAIDRVIKNYLNEQLSIYPLINQMGGVIRYEFSLLKLYISNYNKDDEKDIKKIVERINARYKFFQDRKPKAISKEIIPVVKEMKYKVLFSSLRMNTLLKSNFIIAVYTALAINEEQFNPDKFDTNIFSVKHIWYIM